MPQNDDLGALILLAEEMRRLGYRVIDLLVEHFEKLPSQHVTRVASRRRLEEELREPVPERGRDVEAVFQRVKDDILGNIIHLDHPRFFAFIPSPS